MRTTTMEMLIDGDHEAAMEELRETLNLLRTAVLAPPRVWLALPPSPMEHGP